MHLQDFAGFAGRRIGRSSRIHDLYCGDGVSTILGLHIIGIQARPGQAGSLKLLRDYHDELITTIDVIIIIKMRLS